MRRSLKLRIGLAIGATAAMTSAILLIAFAWGNSGVARDDPTPYHYCEDNWGLRPCTNLATCRANGYPYYCGLYFAPGDCIMVSDPYAACYIARGAICGAKHDCNTGNLVSNDCGERVDKCVFD